MKHTLIVSLIFFLFVSISRGQDTSLPVNDSLPFYSMSLEELMNVTVTVASQKPMTNRESPGIITILTQEEIKKSGANDLMDFLKMVPGFDFGVDVEGVVGVGVRGNWANEGKVILLWDGIEMNEDLYSTLQFGSHYPLDRIKRLEIIRGPGSAMYGGNAEYAVINVITSDNQDFDGVYASVLNSMMSHTLKSRNVSLAAGKTIGNAHINLSTIIVEGNRSQDTYTDFSGNSYDMSSQSGLSSKKYRVDFFLKGLSVTGLYDNYSVEQRDGYEGIYLRAYKTEFNSSHISAKYEITASNKLTVTPGFRLKFQEPWKYSKAITDDEFEPYNTGVKKNEYYINSSYDPNEKINIIAGLAYYHQTAIQKFDTVFFSNGNSRFNIDNYSGFLQSIIKLSTFNIILGSRYDYNPIYGPSFVPRIGLTKVWEKFHLKTLYSSAFRTPSIENINASPNIQPEKTFIAELEAGYRLTSHSYLTANIYDITTLNPIIYYYDNNGEDKYINETSTGTRGIEVEYKWKLKGWYAAINYSYFTTAGHTPVSIYEVPDHPGKLLAFPSHKFAFNGNIHLTENVNLNPSGRYVSTRYSFRRDINNKISAGAFTPSIFADLALNFENIFCEGFSIQAACMNVFDRNVYYIQPYDGNHSPLPGASREYQLKVKYSFSFKEK